MTETDWVNKLAELGQRYRFKRRDGVSENRLLDIEREIGALPSDLRSLYKVTNGIRYEWFNILPIEQQENISETWDGFKRANNLTTSKFLNRSKELFDRFLIIAQMSGGHCACIDRRDCSLWFQDADGIHQTSMTLAEFVETTMREVAEL